MTLCQHVNNVFCTLCNIFWFCHLWLIFMTLLFRKLVNKTDIFLVAFLFLEPSTPCKKQKYIHCSEYMKWHLKELVSCEDSWWLTVLKENCCQLVWLTSLVMNCKSLCWLVILKMCMHLVPGSGYAVGFSVWCSKPAEGMLSFLALFNVIFKYLFFCSPL